MPQTIMDCNCTNNMLRALRREYVRVETHIQYIRAKIEIEKNGEKLTPSGRIRTAFVKTWEDAHPTHTGET